MTVVDPLFVKFFGGDRLESRKPGYLGKTTWLIKEIAKKCTIFLVDFAARFRRNFVFRRLSREHENYRETRLKNAMDTKS